MLVLVFGATDRPDHSDIGHLIVPRQWNDPDTLGLVPHRWAMDNGCFVGFDPGAYLRMIYAYRKQMGCLFVVAPDAVGDAAETRALWAFWSPVVRACGHRPAFVLQDGITHGGVPWDEDPAIFVGGTTRFKESTEVRSLCAYAKTRGLWVHWGRVNGKRRYELAQLAGADSIDGRGFSIAPNINIPKATIQWPRELAQQPLLPS